MDSNTNSTLHEVTVLIVILLYIYTNEVKTNILLSNNNNKCVIIIQKITVNIYIEFGVTIMIIH